MGKSDLHVSLRIVAMNRTEYWVKSGRSGKLGCVVRMVADSILPHAECGPNDHRKDAPPPFMVSAASGEHTSHTVWFRMWTGRILPEQIWIIFFKLFIWIIFGIVKITHWLGFVESSDDMLKHIVTKSVLKSNIMYSGVRRPDGQLDQIPHGAA